MQTTEQEGDVRIASTPDGGDICLADNGLFEMGPGLDSAVYLSLFGGNSDDDGSDENPLQWWGNLIETETDRQYRSETQYLLRAIPAVPRNLLRVQQAAARDLAWMVSSGVASEVAVEASLPAVNAVRIAVVVDGDQTIEFLETWQASV